MLRRGPDRKRLATLTSEVDMSKFKITIEPALKHRLLFTLGITFDELKECINKRSELVQDAAKSTDSFTVASATNRGRTLKLTCAHRTSFLHQVVHQGKMVLMEETGRILQIIDATPTFEDQVIGDVPASTEDQDISDAPASTEKQDISDAPTSTEKKDIGHASASTEKQDTGDAPASTNQSINWGDLRRLQPIHTDFGFDAGQPIDRYYIEKFLWSHRADISGNILEIGDDTYTKLFGNSVLSSDVLHVSGAEQSTIVGDLASGLNIPSEKFDCIILTQTLPFIYDVKSALQNCHSALKPGGVLLATVNGISQISKFDMERWGDFWRFTDLSMKKLLDSIYLAESVSVQTYGNFLSSVAFLGGLPAQELTLNELDYCDPAYQVLIGARAVRDVQLLTNSAE